MAQMEMNTMIDILDLMKALAAQRKVYHGEDDLKHAFAWELHRRFTNSAVRLERPLNVNGNRLHLDLFIKLPDGPMAFELKYKTRKLEVELDGEAFSLATHDAPDGGRYDFIKDIMRLENIVWSMAGCVGHAIILTNESAYWKRPRPPGTNDEAFCLAEGRILSGSMSWAEKTAKNTRAARPEILKLAGEYKLNWQDFSVASSDACGQFRYLSVPISK